MEFFETLHTARALRRYKPDPISDEDIRAMLEAAHAGPSGSNRQARHWIVVRDPEQKQRLADLNRRFVSKYLEYNRPRLDAVEHYKGDRRSRFLDAVEYQMEHMHEVPLLIIACTDMERDSSAAAIDGMKPGSAFGAGVQAATEVWGSVQNLLLAARALGIGTVPTTLAFGDRDAAREVLGLPPHVLPMVMVPMGHPTGRHGKINRRPLDEVVHYDRFGGQSGG